MYGKDVKRKVVMRDYDVQSGKVFRQIIDEDSGEIIKEYWINETDKQPGRPPGGKKAHFLKLYTTNWRDIVTSKKLTPYECGVFSMLLAYMDWQSPYIVNPDTGTNMSESEVSALLHISRTQLHSTLQSLVDKGLVAKINKGIGRESHFMLNTNVCFNGNAIKDVNDNTVFQKDCAYKPKVEIKYKTAQQK